VNDTRAGENGTELVRRLGLFDSTMMMVGIVIGSGIFLITGIMAKSLPSGGLILLAWAVGGLLVLAGALTFAELGASFPQAGGQYVYLREAYGPWAGFLFGWILCLVSMGGAIAAAAVGFAEYFGYFFPSLSTNNIFFSTTIPIGRDGFHYSFSMGQIVAVLAILSLSSVNYIGAGLGKTVQNIITVIKIGTMVGFIILGLTFGTGRGSIDFSFSPGNAGPDFSQILIGFGVALIAVSWAFDGWHNINYVAGEIKAPKRNVPITLILGTLIITLLYLFMNVVYLIALPVEEMSGVTRIAEKATGAMFGGTSASLVSAAVLISTFGSLNGAIFVAPRVYYAMAKDELFFKKAAIIHPRFRTPSFAIVIQAAWACVLALSGTYEQLFTYVTFLNLVFWIAGTAAVFELRRKYPDLPRPYKTWGYPVVPLLFIVSLSGLLFNTLINRPVESLAGLGLALLGIPVYFLWRKKN
jgi:APA family basic amino acid/polyamine antiporter